MTTKIGRQFSIGLARETTRGTTPASASFWVRHDENGLQEKRDFATQEFSIGVIEDAIGADVVKEYVDGDLKMPVTDKAIGLLLYATLGTVSTAANTPETGVYTHTLSVLQDASHPTVSAYIDDPASGQDYTHANCVITALELAAEAGKYAMLTVGMRGRKGVAATLTPAITSENIFRPQDVSLKQATNLAGLGAATAQAVRKVSIKFEANIEDDDVLSSTSPSDFYNKQFVVTGSLEAVYRNESDFKQYALAGTARAIRLTLANTGVTIGATTNPKVQIDLAKCIFTEIAVNRGANDVVTQTLSFKAYYSTSDAQSVAATVVNTQSSY